MVRAPLEEQEVSEVMGHPEETAAIYSSVAKLSKIKPVIFLSRRPPGRAGLEALGEQGVMEALEVKAAVVRASVVAAMVALRERQVNREARVTMAPAVNQAASFRPKDVNDG